MKRQNIIIVDVETTVTDKVADFGAVVCTRKGEILTQCAVLIRDIYDNPTDHPLFFKTDDDKTGIWSKSGQDKRYCVYTSMLNAGSRMLASVNAVNRWLERAKLQYDAILTAYNLPFDVAKCQNTGIDLAIFHRNFCLWKACYTQFVHTRAYRDFVLKTHAFNIPTKFQNMSYKTNAETMARFVSNDPYLEDEPHTSMEDIIFYEMPLLVKLCKRRSINWLLTETNAYNWRDVQVKDWFKPS